MKGCLKILQTIWDEWLGGPDEILVKSGKKNFLKIFSTFFFIGLKDSPLNFQNDGVEEKIEKKSFRGTGTTFRGQKSNFLTGRDDGRVGILPAIKSYWLSLGWDY